MAGIVYGGLLWTGYRRRRETWTRRSWVSFGISLLVAFLLLAAALWMASGVDNGVYNGMSHRSRSLYFYTMFALLLAGIAASAGLILSFARGNPHHQFARTLGGFRRLSESSREDLQQVHLRDKLRNALVLRGFVLVAERSDAQSFGSWERDYRRTGNRVRLSWNSDTCLFTLKSGSTFQRRVAKGASKLVGAGLNDFLDHIEAPAVHNPSPVS